MDDRDTRTDGVPATSRRDTPFGRGLPLGDWLGVSVRVHWSVLVVLALVATMLATADLPASHAGATAAGYWLVGTATALAFFLTLLAHELAHALVARHYAVTVHRITLWLLGGMTELAGEAPTPKADALIAAAGPATSLVLGGLLAAAAAVVGGDGVVVSGLVWLALFNLVLGAFNLLPGAPLDGGRLLRALLWWGGHDRDRAAERAASAGRVLGMSLVGLGVLGALLGSFGGLWSALLGWFILTGATSERYAARAESLHGLTVRDAMTPEPWVAPSWWTVEQLAGHLATSLPHTEVFPVVDVDGRFAGLVTLAGLVEVPPGRRSTTRVGDVVTRDLQLLRPGPDTPLADLLLPLHLRGGMAVVLDRDRPVGIITDRDLARVARLSRVCRQGEDRAGSVAAEGPGQGETPEPDPR